MFHPVNYITETVLKSRYLFSWGVYDFEGFRLQMGLWWKSCLDQIVCTYKSFATSMFDMITAPTPIVIKIFHAFSIKSPLFMSFFFFVRGHLETLIWLIICIRLRSKTKSLLLNFNLILILSRKLLFYEVIRAHL